MTGTAGRRATVAIVRSPEYDPAQLAGSVARAIELVGGIDDLVKPRTRVFLKINHLPPPSPPERGIVTHPMVTEAVIRFLQGKGAEVTVGDDIHRAEDGFGMSGYSEMCLRVGAPLLNLRESGFAERPAGGGMLKTVYVSRAALQADVVVDLAKLKTHSLTVYTGAVKNMYGTVPASFRRDFHARFVRSEDFSLMLTDVYAAARPQLAIMDAVDAMEGAGPSGGAVRRVGAILASRDGVALDAVAGSIIGLKPVDVDTTRLCHERGLGAGRLEQIEVAGEAIEAVGVSDFKLPAAATRALLRRVPPLLSTFLMRQLSLRPQIDAGRCTACAECVRICPTGAMSLDGGTARVSHAACIECLCCHEVCRYDAIELARRPLGAAAGRLAGALRGRRP